MTGIFIALALVTAGLSDEAKSPRYADCIALVEADLELGRTAAQQWTQEGGGADAQHCLAVADSAAGFHKLAAIRLEEISERDDAGDDYVRARVLAQATETWLLVGAVSEARRTFDAAQELTPDSGELQLTAARLFFAETNWLNVVRAVDRAQKEGFVSASAFLLRATAMYELGDYQSSAEDVVNTLSLDPFNLDALVLRGKIQQTGIDIDVFYDAPPAN